MTLLPPNASPLERALEAATARVGAIPIPGGLWDPATCPLAILPWLAWALSVDTWDPDWSEATKRAAVAGSIALHRMKGTPAAIEAVLARHDELLTLAEWWEADLPPHNFEVRLQLGAASGARATAAFADAIARDVARVKPVREHFNLIQQLDAVGRVGIQGVARAALFTREEMALTIDDSQPWATLLQDENGEPLQDDAGAFLDCAA